MSRDWFTTTVDDCLDAAVRSRTETIQASGYKPSGMFPIVDQGAKPIAGWTDDESLVISDGLPLVVFGDHTRALKYVDYPFVRGADGTQLLRTKPTIDTRFFYFALRFVDLPSRGYNRHFTLLRNQEIQVPASLDEQRLIARVLHRVEQAVALQEKLVHTVDRLYASVLRDLFALGLRGEETQDSEIGPIPLSWRTSSINELCRISSGGTPRKAVAEYWSGDTPWVSGKDLKRPVLSDAMDHLSQEGVHSGSRMAPEGSVLLLVRGMGLAKDLPVACISRPMAFNQDVKALVLKDEFNDLSGHFLRSAIYAGKSRLLSQIVSSAHGTMTLNLNDVENLQIARPTDPDEVHDIEMTIRAIENKADLHRQKLATLQELYLRLLRDLMTGEVAPDQFVLPASEYGSAV